jgi:hypothetical protein
VTPFVRELVRHRAGDRCEYCRIPQYATPHLTFHIEHVIAVQHGGSDDPSNLALACDRCNLHKGTNLSAIDPTTNNVVQLFNPRRDDWHDHFGQANYRVVGLTDVGRATVRLLNINAPRRVEVRVELKLDLTID